MRDGAKATALVVLAAILLIPPSTARAAFEGANGQIAFSRSVRGQDDIWVLDPWTRQRRSLTSTASARESLPDWNAQGTMLAYTRCGLSEFSNCDIWVMDADGGGQRRLTSTAAQESWPVWSPDGTSIAYTSNADDELQDIYVMDADGSNPRRLTETIGFDAYPEWSPDGTRIAFTSDRAAVDDIWVMDADGSDPTRLTSGPAIDERPDWSPEGSLITFSRDGDLYTMRPDGTGLVRLTATDQWEFGPTFSPDGTRIAYDLQADDGRIGLWIMWADGSHATQRTFRALDLFPDWQPV